MYSETTRGIEVGVTPVLLAEQSNLKDQFVFSYAVTLTNHSERACQLLNRRWLIKDGTGTLEEVVGDGVVGEQPELSPGQAYEYKSFCPLTTPTGNMRGSFGFVDTESGEKFDVKIPLFFLRAD